ncbi:hypothetical protein GCM10010840_08770 [Deinococcus aerolatus]|uniref:Uncharacterized protein n=1 Tax=Deinococcus aerolatus TaxID=522487 RepID=A0ABQ2G3K5_9DEIO|nr:hypothetical protein GCM10010840_08770 [Deinococcus aerolatus]
MRGRDLEAIARGAYQQNGAGNRAHRLQGRPEDDVEDLRGSGGSSEGFGDVLEVLSQGGRRGGRPDKIGHPRSIAPDRNAASRTHKMQSDVCRDPTSLNPFVKAGAGASLRCSLQAT